MDKAVVYGLLILFLGIAIGYSISDMATIEESPGGMKVPELSVSFGSIDENNTVSRVLSYNIFLSNYGDEDVYVNSVEPIFGEHISRRVVTENNTIAVDRTISAKSSVEISGQVKLNSTGSPKAEGSIIGFNISSTETIYNSWAEI